MGLKGWQSWLGRRVSARRLERAASRPRLLAEYLEDRVVPATLDIDGSGNLTFLAKAGETNSLYLALAAKAYAFVDATSVITLGDGAVAAGWTGNGTKTVTGPDASVSTITVDLGDQDDSLDLISFDAAIAPFSAEGGGNLVIAGDTATVSSAVIILGDVSVTGFQTITVGAALLTAGGGVTSGRITLAAGGAVVLDADLATGSVTQADAAGSQTPTSGSINVTAGAFLIRPGEGIAGAGRVVTGDATLTGANAGGTDVATSGGISLTVTGAGDIGLSAADAVVTGDAARVGPAADFAIAGSIFLSADRVNGGTAGRPLDLQLGTPAGAANLTPGLVDVFTDGGAGALGEIQLTSDRALNVQSLDTANTAGQTVRVFTTAGAPLNLLTTADLDADAVTLGGPATGDVTHTAFLIAASLTINAATLTLTDLNLAGVATLIADDVVIGPLAALLVGGDVTLQARTSPRVITLGTDGAGALGLTDAELDRITTTGALVIGSAANTGNLRLTGPITAPATWHTLDLRTGGAVTDNGGTITAPNLILRAATGVGAAGAADLNLAVANLTVTNTASGAVVLSNTAATLSLALSQAGGGNVTLNQAGDLFVAGAVTVGGAGGLTINVTGAFTSGAKITAGGAVSVTAAGAVTVNAEIDPTAVTITSDGDVTINAPVSAANAVTVTAGQTTNVGSVTVTTAGSLTTTVAASTITVTAGGAKGTIIFSGTVSSAGAVTLRASAAAGDIILNTTPGNPDLSAAGALTINLGGTLYLYGARIRAAAAAVAGGAGANTIVADYGAGVATTWTVSGANAGSVANAAITVAAGLTFTGVEDLTGGAQADTFHFTGAAALAGVIDGQGGANALSYAGYGSARTLSVTAAGGVDGADGTDAGAVPSLAGFSNINSLTGSGSGDTFYFDATATLTTVDGGAGPDLFVLNVHFTANLLGGAGDDIFRFNAPAVVLTGGINGGSELDTLEYPGYTAPVVVSVTAAGASDGFNGTATGVSAGFSNLNTLIAPPGAGGGQLTVTGTNGPDAVTVTATAVTLNGRTLNYGSFSSLAVNTLAGDDVFTVTSTGPVTALSGGNDNDTFNITMTNSATTLDGNDGDDTFTVTATGAGGALTILAGNGDDLVTVSAGGLVAAVTADGIAGANDRLVVNGTDLADAFTLTGTTVARAGSATITYAAFDQLAVNGLGGDDVFGVQGAGTPTTVNGNLGDDTIAVGNAANRLDDILAALAVNGNEGSNTLNLNDQGAAAAGTYTLTPTTFQRTGTALVTYRTIQSLTLDAGPGDDTIELSSTTTGVVNAGPGNDTFRLRDFAGLATLNGQAGTNLLDLTLAGGVVNTVGTLLLSAGIVVHSSPSSAVITGRLDLGGATRVFAVADGAAAADLIIQAVLSGTGGLTKTGPGTLVLTADNTYSGTTTVDGGTLLVNGTQQSSSTTVNSTGTLGGTGTVRDVIVSQGGTLKPGGTTSTGILQAVAVTFQPGSTFAVRLNGTAPGSGYDQLVSGPVTVAAGSRLQVTLGPGFPATTSDRLTLITGPVAGAFEGLPEGEAVALGGRLFQVRYTSGAFLTRIQLPTATAVPAVSATVFGQAVVFTASVTAGNYVGGPLPFTGVMNLTVDGAPQPPSAVGADGRTSFAVGVPLAVGAHTIAVSYGGDLNFLGSSASLIHTVSPLPDPLKAPTITSLTSSAQTTLLGRAVTFAVQVRAAAGTGTPTGAVTFRDGASLLGSQPLDAAGQARLSTAALGAGLHTITAVYAGDGAFRGGTTDLVQRIATSLNQATVYQIYADLLRREADAGGLDGWTAALDQGRSAAEVAQAILASREYRELAVRGAYEKYLDRTADRAGLDAFVAALSAGMTVEQLEAIILGSPEYLQRRGGGTNEGFVQALYRDVLLRDADAAGRAAFLGFLNAGGDRGLLAKVVLGSPEYQRRLVDSYYRLFLRRGADAAGLGAFVGYLQGGGQSEAVIAAILAAEEYRLRLQ